MESQLGLSQHRTIHPHTFIILLRHLKDRQLLRHDSPWLRPRDNSVLGEIRNTAMVAQKVLIEEQLAVHNVGGAVQNTQNSVGEDRLFVLSGMFQGANGSTHRFPEIGFPVRIFIRGRLCGS